MLVISKSTLHNIVAMSLLLSMAGKGFAFCPATTVARLWGLGGSITTKNPHFTFSHGNRKSLWLLARSPSNNIGILYSPRLEFSSSTSINLATNAVGPSKSRSSSDWVVPETVDIPEDKLDFSFVRSSGAGGQNVNKVNTKVEIRFCVDQATWIPEEVRDRLKAQQANRISKDGYIALHSQEHRTQLQNRKAVISKLKDVLLQAWVRPKERKQRKGVSKAAKERNKEFKKRRSETKRNRKAVDW